MPLNGANITYGTIGGLLLFSGIRGSTIVATIQSVLSGTLNPPDTEPIWVNAPDTNPGSSSSAASGSQNYLTIAEYLVKNGYKNAAAAGIVGCIAGESGGDPEALEDKSTPIALNSGGGGLIQWTPISSYPGLVTGNASKDLDAQLPAIIAYNNGRGSFHIEALNQQTDPVAAADYYSTYFEAPAVTDSDVVPSVAKSVYAQLLSGAPSVNVNSPGAIPGVTPSAQPGVSL